MLIIQDLEKYKQDLEIYRIEQRQKYLAKHPQFNLSQQIGGTFNNNISNNSISVNSVSNQTNSQQNTNDFFRVKNTIQKEDTNSSQQSMMTPDLGNQNSQSFTRIQKSDTSSISQNDFPSQDQNMFQQININNSVHIQPNVHKNQVNFSATKNSKKKKMTTNTVSQNTSNISQQSSSNYASQSQNIQKTIIHGNDNINQIIQQNQNSTQGLNQNSRNMNNEVNLDRVSSKTHEVFDPNSELSTTFLLKKYSMDEIIQMKQDKIRKQREAMVKAKQTRNRALLSQLQTPVEDDGKKTISIQYNSENEPKINIE